LILAGSTVGVLLVFHDFVTETLVERRFSKVDVMTGLPQSLNKTMDQNIPARIEHPKGTFPLIRVKMWMCYSVV